MINRCDRGRIVLITMFFTGCAFFAVGLHAQQTCRSERVEAPSKPAEVERRHLDSLVTAELRAEALAEARASGVTDPAGLLFVTRAQGDSDVVIKPHGLNFRPTPNLEILARATLASLPTREAYHRVVRLDTVAIPFAPAGSRRTECPPFLLNRDQAQQALYSFLWHYPAAQRLMGRHTQLVLAMVATRDGHGVAPIIARSSGIAEIDEFAIRPFAEQLRFAPAKLGDVAVDVVVTLPLNLDLPRNWRPLLSPP